MSEFMSMPEQPAAASPRATGRSKGEKSSDQQASSLGSAENRLQEHRARLNRARSRYHKCAQRAEVGPDWAEFIAPTARDMVAAFTDLVADDAFWIDVQLRAMGKVSESTRAQLEEVMTSNLDGLLDLLGYEDPPPPPSVELAADVVESFQRLFDDPSDQFRRMELVADARRQLIIYNYRLRRLLRVWEDPESDDPSIGDKLLAALKRGAAAAAPGVLAASTVGALFPAAGAVGAGAAVMEGVKEGTKELLTSTIKTGATAAMGAKLEGEKYLSNSGFFYSELSADVSQLSFLSGYLLGPARSETAPSAELHEFVTALSIQIKRLIFRILRWMTPYRTELTLLKPQLDAAIDALSSLEAWIDLPYEPEWASVSSSVVVSLTTVKEKLELFAAFASK